MCNLYSNTRSRDELKRLFNFRDSQLGNLAESPAIFPEQTAPVVHLGIGDLDISFMSWGFPPPPQGNRPVTNIRNAASPFWRPWLKTGQRCLIPATSFCEWTDTRPKVPHWFALSDERPLFFFAGVWRHWGGIRKGVTGDHLVYAFLTTDANDVVAPIHAKAMPVLLTDEDEYDLWLHGDPADAMKLQRPLPADKLKVVATGELEDPPSSARLL